MDAEELRAAVDDVLDRQLDPDMEPREIPHARLERHHRLDLSYLATPAWEGSTVHPHTRLCSSQDRHLHTLTRNSDVSRRLFEAGLRLLGDSIVAYHARKERKGQLRFYPPIILTFWSGFETFVRYASELLLITVPTVPDPVAVHLQERERFVNFRGEVETRERYRPVLSRYATLLRHGYGLSVDRGSSWWQKLESARDVRDYYTHLDVMDPRAVSTDDVLEFMEAILLGIICPSAMIRRTLLLGVYDLYWQWAALSELVQPYVEQPFFKDWPFDEGYMFHCNFDGVDVTRFPSVHGDDHYRDALTRAARRTHADDAPASRDAHQTD